MIGPLAEIIVQVAASVAGTAGAAAVGKAWEWLKDYVSRGDVRTLRAALEALGTTTPDQIRALIHSRFRDAKPALPPEDRENLTALVVSLAGSAKTLTTRGLGTAQPANLRDLMLRLVQGIRTTRKAGEKATPDCDWVLRQFLGMGGFGEVWLARNSRAPALPGRVYKFFTAADARPWIEREKDSLLAVMARLADNPHIVRMTDVAVPAKSHPYIVFDYIDGGSLEDYILSAPAERPRVAPGDLMRTIVRTMAAAHAKQVYHLDLKPGNILLTRHDPRPMVTDFGLARIDAGTPQADSGPAMGTPLYLPPETFLPAVEVKPAQADVFALGVIWYQLLVGRIERPPYDFAAELQALGIDSHNVALIARCLSAQNRRFADAVALEAAMKDDLPSWNPVPAGMLDVSHLFKEYAAQAGK